MIDRVLRTQNWIRNPPTHRVLTANGWVPARVERRLSTGYIVRLTTGGSLFVQSRCVPLGACYNTGINPVQEV